MKHWIRATLLASGLASICPSSVQAQVPHAETPAHVDEAASDAHLADSHSPDAGDHGESAHIAASDEASVSHSIPDLPGLSHPTEGEMHFEAPHEDASSGEHPAHEAVADAHSEGAEGETDPHSDLPAHSGAATDHADPHAPEQHPEALGVGHTTAEAIQGGPFELPPDSQEGAYYKPDWKRYEKEGLFGSMPAEPTRDETPDLFATEKHYLAQLNMPMPDAQRRETLLEMADMYQRYNIKPKLAATYERFIAAFPQDPMVPELYVRLGFLYREVGAFKMALNKFYSVLNASLSIEGAGMESYRLLSLKAQLEIADTYYLMGDYEEAAKFYLRLKRLDLSDADRALVDFKYAYTQYLLKDYPAVVASLQEFIRKYPKHALVPEGHFLLANSFKELGQQRSALAEVLDLLQYQEGRQEDSGAWIYWKKRTGNQLANEFYEQGDFVSALKIYQAMAVLSDAPDWQWPVIYQIGVCYERLRMLPKSIEAYELIDEGVKTLQAKGDTLTPGLDELYQQSQWRLEHLRWIGKTEMEMNELIGQGS